jgi:hypothetical protein
MDLVIPMSILVFVTVFAWMIARVIENPRRAREEVVKAAATNDDVVLVGGARIGAWNFSIPFARLRLSRVGIAVSVPFMKRESAWSGLVRASLIQPIIPIGQGVELQSAGSDPVIFWANRGICWGLLDIIEKHGVPVDRAHSLRL